MTRTAVGAIVGAVLGLLDGASAWIYPEARSTIAVIVIGSTLKGALTGAAAGFAARRSHSLLVAVATGVGVGFVLSTLAARGQPDHYWAIVAPGMLVGVLCGIVTQRYPRNAPVEDRSRSRASLLVVIGGAIVATLSASSQTAPPSDPLAALHPLVGRWAGTTEGEPGKGTVEREYTWILGSRFVQLRNRSVYPPQQKNPKGETHEDVGIFSFDREQKRIVFRQFHVEGFVSHYVQVTSPEERTLVFVTEAIENIPAGWRARETYRFLGADEFEEVFELAQPTKEFAVYSRSRLRRAR